MVNTMPTKLAVSSATPSERGPTSDSCSRVFRQWIFPVVDHIMWYQQQVSMLPRC